MRIERTARAPFAAPLCSPISGEVVRLALPSASADAARRACCGEWAIAAACGVPLDRVLAVFGVRPDGMDAYELWGLLRNIGPSNLYSTTRNERWLLCWSRNLLWPPFGIVGVTLPDGDGHYVVTLNGEVFDPIVAEVVSIGAWENKNVGYEMTDVLVLSKHYLARQWRWA